MAARTRPCQRRHERDCGSVPARRSLSIFDLGYFSLERFRRVGEAEAYWISRFQHDTKVFDAAGKQLACCVSCGNTASNGLVDVSVVLGEKERLGLPPDCGSRAAGSGGAAAAADPRKGPRPWPRAVAGILGYPGMDDFHHQLPAGVADLERSGGALSRPLANRTAVQTVEVAQPVGGTRDRTPRRNGRWRFCMPN